jgi:hypothetical protein
MIDRGDIDPFGAELGEDLHCLPPSRLRSCAPMRMFCIQVPTLQHVGIFALGYSALQFTVAGLKDISSSRRPGMTADMIRTSEALY